MQRLCNYNYPMNKRITYIDIAKGLGILVIVLAHNDLAGYHPTLHKFIYAFHIPLFFFLSGMFFRPERAFGETTRRRFNTLLKPYLFAIFLIYLGEATFSNMTFPVIAGRIAKSMYATGYYIDWVQLWFIPHLFAANLFAWVAWRVLFGRVKLDWLRWLLLFAMLAAGVLTLLWPGVPPGLRAPVVAYVLCLAAMAAQTASAWHAGRTGVVAALGGALFLTSDALLATNRFHTPLPLATLWVLATYWAAQWLIASALPPRRA